MQHTHPHRPSDPTDAVVSDLLTHSRTVPLLTAPEELALAKRVERGDLRAKDRMVEANIRLVVSLSRRYRGHGVPFADLVQEGMIGLIRAVEKFDWRRGYRLSTYATVWVRQALGACLAASSRMIRLPVRMSQLASRLTKLEQTMSLELGRTPTEHELADRASVPLPKLRRIRTADRSLVSLDTPVHRAEGTTLGHGVASDEQPVDLRVIEAEGRAALRSALSQLGRDELQVLEVRYGGDGCSGEEAARRLGCPAHRLRAVEHDALARLRDAPGLDDLREAA